MVTQTEIETGDYHDLAEAIRRGCKLRPKKLRRYFQRGDNMACALGAAATGVGNRRPKRKHSWRDGLFEISPEFKDDATHPLTHERMSLGDAIVELDDETAHSREEIADWLCREGGCEHVLIEPAVIPRSFKPKQPLKIQIGEEMIDALAKRFRLSPDAVRARLGRKRGFAAFAMNWGGMRS
jgi:hypothetical protein